MRIYKVKRYITIIWAGGFGLIALFGLILFILRESYADAMIALVSLGSALIMGLGLSKALIITTDDDIKKSVFGKIRQERKWIWIYDIRTVRSTATGAYSTILSWATEPQYRGTGGLFSGSQKNAKSGTLFVTSSVVEYSKLLKEIRNKAPHAEIDSLTEEIISKDV